MARATGFLRGWIAAWVARRGLRHPVLFLLFAGLLLVDLVVPDLVPLADELGLALLTALFAAWRVRRQPAPPQAHPPPAGPAGG